MPPLMMLDPPLGLWVQAQVEVLVLALLQLQLVLSHRHHHHSQRQQQQQEPLRRRRVSMASWHTWRRRRQPHRAKLWSRMPHLPLTQLACQRAWRTLSTTWLARYNNNKTTSTSTPTLTH